MSALPFELKNSSIWCQALAKGIGYTRMQTTMPFYRTIPTLPMNSKSSMTIEAQGELKMHDISCADDMIVPQFNKYSKRLGTLDIAGLAKQVKLCEMLEARALLNTTSEGALKALARVILRESADAIVNYHWSQIAKAIVENVSVKDYNDQSQVITPNEDGVKTITIKTIDQLLTLPETINTAMGGHNYPNLPMGHLHIVMPEGYISLLNQNSSKLGAGCCLLERVTYGNNVASDGIYRLQSFGGVNTYIYTNYPRSVLKTTGGEGFGFFDARMQFMYMSPQYFTLNRNSNREMVGRELSSMVGVDPVIDATLIYAPDNKLIPMTLELLSISAFSRRTRNACFVLKFDPALETALTTDLPAVSDFVPPTPDGTEIPPVLYDEPVVTTRKAKATGSKATRARADATDNVSVDLDSTPKIQG